MALTPSTMLPLDTLAPAFSLPEFDSRGEEIGRVNLKDLRIENGLLIIFLCNHCPYVIHLRKELARVTQEFIKRGIAVVGINSNDAETYPEDSPAKMALEKKTVGYPFPYLFDKTQEVARAYQAACTPDFFLFNPLLRLVYRGQFDDSRPGNSNLVTGKDLKEAAEALLKHQPPVSHQLPSMGCNIKWKVK